jgi:hypothetical protein
MRVCLTAALAILVIAGDQCRDPAAATPASDRPTAFHPPEIILDGSKYGWMRHPSFGGYPAGMFPAFADMDGDGKTDLVVGVTDWSSRPAGRLLVFRNQGTKTQPRYAKPKWLDETVPTGRIPDG